MTAKEQRQALKKRITEGDPMSWVVLSKRTGYKVSTLKQVIGQGRASYWMALRLARALDCDITIFV